MSYCLKQLIKFLMRWLGIIRLYQFARRKQIVILTIHGVMDEQDKPSWQPLRPQLSRDKLEEYLRVLSKRYRFISLADAVEMLKGRKPIKPYSLVLTFDDGYRNNLTHALPILRRYNAPVTFFIPTGFLDNPRPFWFDRLDYALQHARVNGREVKVGSFTMCLDSSSREALQESFERLRRTAKEQKMSDLDFLRELEQLSEQLETESGRALADIQGDDNCSAIMSWGDVERIGDGDVTFGSHTVDHIRLGLVNDEVACEQLTRSKHDVEIHTGKPCFCLAYPNGSYSRETINLAENCKYSCCVTSIEGLNRVKDDLMRLRRIGLPTNLRSTDLLFSISVVCS